MNDYQWNKTLVEKNVTYTLEVDGKLIVIENVPARVNAETGEQLFAPETVEQLAKTCLGAKETQAHVASACVRIRIIQRLEVCLDSSRARVF